MKGKRRSILLALALCLSLLPLSAGAAKDEVSCGEKNETVLASMEDGVVTIHATGLVTVSQQSEIGVEYGMPVTIRPYPAEEITAVVLGENVSGVADGVFQDCTSLSEITLGEDADTIGARAFAGCTALTGVELPEGISTLGDGAFAGCTALTTVTLADEMTLTAVGQGVFEGCPIEKVKVGESWQTAPAKQAQLAQLFPGLDPAAVEKDGGLPVLPLVIGGCVAAAVVVLAVLRRRG